MTQQELSGLYYLSKKIKRDKERLRELEASSEVYAAPEGGGVQSGRTSDPTGKRALAIASLKEEIENNLVRMIEEENRLRAYIAGVDNVLMQLILQYRHIDMLKWRQVAARIGGGNTEESVKKMYYRFIENS